MKFKLTDIFNLKEHHLSTRDSKIKYILDNQDGNITGYSFIKDDLEVLSDQEIDKIYVGVEKKVEAKKDAGVIKEDSNQTKRMKQLVESFSNKNEVIKEDSNKEINDETLNEEFSRLKKLSKHRIDEYGNDSLRQSGMPYAGYAETVNTFIPNTKAYTMASYGELSSEEALEVAIKRVLSSGTPINNMSFYDEINWNLNKLGFETKMPVDIKNAMRKLVKGDIDTSVD